MAAMQTEPAGWTAIVADDSSLIRDTVRSALGAAWRVFVAANGIEAVAYARSTRARLVVLDVRMPRMDGIEACVEIRALPHYASVPIVMLTAWDDEVVRRRARHAGATTVFTKPFTFQTLKAGIAPLLVPGRDATARATDGLELAEPPTEWPVMDGSEPIADQEALNVCRRVDVAADQRSYASFAEVMDALREADKR